MKETRREDQPRADLKPGCPEDAIEDLQPADQDAETVTGGAYEGYMSLTFQKQGASKGQPLPPSQSK